MRNDTENILIASWLLGDHLGDLRYFKPNYFQDRNNPDIVRMLQAQKTGLDVFRKYRDDYLDLQNMYMPFVYDAAFNDAIKDFPLLWARAGATPQEIRENCTALADRLQGCSQNATIQKDILSLWKKEKEEFCNAGVVSYGIDRLDNVTGGIFPGHLITLAARPGGGKSALALQIAAHVALHERRKVLYFTLEMPITEQLDRLLMQNVGVENSSRLKQGNLRLDEMQKFQDYIAHIEAAGLLKFSTERNISRIEAAVKEESPFMIVIDQLTQLQFDGRQFTNDLERYKALTRHLKAFANLSGVTVLLLCQLNRTATGKDPSVSQLKDSGSIEEDSDDVFILYPPPGYEDEETTRATYKYLKVAKQRSGRTTVIKDVVFDPESLCIYENYK